MSLSRQFFREMRPLFRMLDDVSFGRHPASPFGSVGFPHSSRFGPTHEIFNNFANQPAIDVSDHGNHFTVEADLPGVPKENVSVRVGDKGHSITIKGKVAESGGAEPPKISATSDKSTDTETVEAGATGSQAVSKVDDSSAQLSTERRFTRNVQFTRTVWLPKPVDTKKVEAKMKDGLLSLTLQKLTDDKESTSIPIADGA